MGVTKQEQLPARDAPEEVAPGVVRMQLPINMPGLAHVNCYAIVDRDGLVIVDPGVPGPSSWKALTQRMRRAGLRIRDVHTVVVTHSHPDHFGGAGRLAQEANADIVTHAAFRTWGDPPPPPDPCVEDGGLAAGEEPGEQADAEPWGKTTPWGGQGYRGARSRRWVWRAMRMTGLFVMPRPTRRVADGDEVTIGGRTWLGLHTPGHTSDHLCLFEPESGTLLSGDHVLPTITPHISGIGGGPDPLGEFFTSLQKVAVLPGVRRALPAHGGVIDDVAGRVSDIKEHHRERLDRLRDASQALGPATVETLSHELFRPARWGPMAESETFAHLEYLRFAGLAERGDRGGRYVYTLTGAGEERVGSESPAAS